MSALILKRVLFENYESLFFMLTNDTFALALTFQRWMNNVSFLIKDAILLLMNSDLDFTT